MARDNSSLESVAVPDTLPVLSLGHHEPGSATPCVMEAASWLAGEPWSDHPRSVHPAIAGVARLVNDSVGDTERQSLWPLVLASLDTARPRHLILNWRLKRFAHRTAESVDPSPELWRRVLNRFGELTGCDLRLVSASKAETLQVLLAPLAIDRRRETAP